MKKANIVIIAIIALSFVIAVWFYPALPSEVTSHWNIQGEADGYMGKFWGTFLMPFLILGIYLLLLIVPKIDPLKKNIEKFRSYFDWFIAILIIFCFYLHCLIIAWNLGYRFNMGQLMIPALGLLFFYSGLLMEKAERNWFIGIRTPWTLSDERVWDKTHQLGAKMFKLSGLIALFGIIVPQHAFYLVLIPILTSAFVPMFYSYFLYRKLNKN